MRAGAPPRVSPAVAWAGAGWLGALVGWQVTGPDGAVRAPSPRLATALCLFAAVVVVGMLVRRPPSWRSLRWTVVGVVVAAVACCWSAGARRHALASGPLVALANGGGGAVVVATVASEPMPRPDGTWWSLVGLGTVDGRAARGRAVWADQPTPVPVGTTVRFTATARPLGDDEFDATLRRRHAVARLAGSPHRVVAPPGPVLGTVEQVRAAIRAAARAGLSGDAAGLAVGLVTGDTRHLSDVAAEDMRATGLTHLVAVSGSNVALVAGAVALAARRRSVRLRRLVVALSVLAFVVTTRAEPSVLRAGVMASGVLAAEAVGRPRSPLHALAVALLVLVLADPAAAGSLGLVLSAAATVGVLVVAPVVASRFPAWLPEPVAALVAATLGAQVAVAPFLVATTGSVPLAALPANVVAVPAAAVASMIAVLGAVVAQVHVGAGGAVLALADPPLQAVLAVARAGVDGPVVATGAPLALVGGAAGTVAVLARGGSGTRRWAVRLLAALAIAAVLARAPTGWRQPSTLAVTAIDVGQGDSLLVTTASGHRVLVDAGRDARAAEWLRRHGIVRLDLVVVTHGDADHAGGLDELLEVVDAPTIWVGSSPDGAVESVWARDWRDPPGPAPPEPPGVVGVRAGRRAVVGSALVEVLAPPVGHDLAGTQGGRNDRSVVLRVTEGARTALLAGDAEAAAQGWMMDHVDDLAAQLLVVPHHGAATSDPAFLRAVAPRVAVVSVGADNGYGHPRAEVLDVLVDVGATIHRTDRHGTVTAPVPP